MNNIVPSSEYIDTICRLYGSVYDDRIEDCKPPTAGTSYRDAGRDWVPGEVAGHKSLIAFQRELEDQGIKLSTSKIRKILITGGRWTTERSRGIGELFEEYTRAVDDGGKGLAHDVAVARIAEELGVSIVTVSVNLPYWNVVYKLENKSGNARRCERWRNRKASSWSKECKTYNDML